ALELGRIGDRAAEQQPEVVGVDLLEALGVGELARDGLGRGARELPLVESLQRELAGAAPAGAGIGHVSRAASAGWPSRSPRARSLGPSARRAPGPAPRRWW